MAGVGATGTGEGTLPCSECGALMTKRRDRWAPLTNRQLGTHPSLIKRNSRDPDLPSINALRRIAKALGVPVTELLE